MGLDGIGVWGWIGKDMKDWGGGQWSICEYGSGGRSDWNGSNGVLAWRKGWGRWGGGGSMLE